MRNPPHLPGIALLSALLLASGPLASATVLSYDAFSGYGAANLSGQTYKGTGYASGGSWSGGTSTVSTTGGITYTSGQTLPVAGGKVTYSNSGDCTANLNTTAGGSFGLAGLTGSSKIGGAAGTLYYSFLYQKNATIANNWGGFELYNGGTEILGIPTRSANPNTFSWFGRTAGDLKNNLGSGSTFIQDANVHLFVVKIVFNGSGSDQVTIWMDPNLNNPENNQTSSTTYYTTTSGDFRFDNYHIRGSYAYFCDEPRFATTWSDSVGGLIPPVATWNNASGGSWATNTNWTPNTVLNLATTTADFSTLNVSGDTTVTLNGSYSAGPLAFADTSGADGNWILAPGSGGTLTIAGPVAVTNQATTISAALAGTGGMTKSGAGTLVLSATNTYTGGTTVNAGAVRLGAGGSLAGANNLTIGSASFDLNGQNQTVANLNATAGTLTNGAATDSTLTVNSAASTAANCTATLTTPGSGKLNLYFSAPSALSSGWWCIGLNNSANTFKGDITVVGTTDEAGSDGHGGVLGINTDGALGDPANSITLSNGGILANLYNPNAGGGWPSHIGYTLAATRSITLAGPLGGCFRIGYGETCTINSTITGTGGLNHSDGGNLILNAANTYSGDTKVSAGTTTLGSPLALQNSTLDYSGYGGTISFGSLTAATLGGLKGNAALAIPNGFTLSVGNNNQSTSYSAILSGSTGNLTKIGSGKLTLSGTYTYGGSTLVNAGTLEITGSLSTGPVTVSGGTLAGTGSLGGATTILSGGSLAAGTTGIGALTVNNTLTLNPGSTTSLRIAKTGGSLTSDSIIGLSGASYGGVLTVIDVTSDATPLAVDDKFFLFTKTSGNFAGSFTTLNLPIPPVGLKWDTTGLTVDGSIQLIYANQTSPPTYTPAGGGYVGAQTIVMTCADSDSTVYFTADGSTPNSGSPHGTAGSGLASVSVPVNTAAMTIRSFATKAGYVNSTLVSATYSSVATPVWINAAGGNWSTAANWTNNVVVNGAGVTADFSTLSLTADATVTLDSAKTAGNLLFNDPGGYSWIIANGSGTLTLAVTSGSPTIAVNNALITATIDPGIDGTNGLNKTGDGTLVLGGSNTFTGATKISGGTLVLANPLALQNTTLDYSGYGGTLDLSAVSTATLGGLKGNQDLINYATITVGNDNESTVYSGQLNGGGGLAKVGTGTLILSGANGYSGPTTVNAGMLKLASGGQLGTNSLTIGNGTFDINGQNQAAANLTATGGTLTNSAATNSTLVINSAASTTGNCAATLTTQSTGKLNLVLNSSVSPGTANSAVALANTGNTFSGSITVNGNGFNDGVDWHGGLLGINTATSLGDPANPITLNNGGALCNMFNPNPAGGWSGHAVFTLGAGHSINLTGTGGTIRLGYNETCTINCGITGEGGLAKADNGALVLGGSLSNTYLGATTLGGNGKLVLAKTSGAIAIAGNIIISSTEGNGNNTGIVLAGDEQIADSSVIAWTSGDYGGFFRLNGHTETIGGLNCTATGLDPEIENRGYLDTAAYGNSTLIINTVGSNTYSYNGGIRDMDQGTGGGYITLVKTGTGTQILNGHMPNRGTTTVNNGTLQIDCVSSATATTVGSGATLKGSGGVVGTLSISTGGTLAPGDGVGTFSAGNTTLAGTYACEFDGSICDRIAATGSLDITGATLSITLLSPMLEPSYVLATYTTTLTGTIAAVTGLPSGCSLQYDTVNKQILLIKGGYDSWAAAMGLTAGVNDGKMQDPDGDGVSNLMEYALGGNPLNATDNGVSSGTLQTVDGSPTLVQTIATRSGAAFASGTNGSMAATIDGIIYRLEGSHGLDAWTDTISEITPITGGLPVVPAGYEYHTFRTAGPFASTASDFIRLNVTEAP